MTHLNIPYHIADGFDFYYLHINEQKQVRIGICHSVPQILDNGKIELSEKWQWLNGDKSEGKSVVVEM